MVDEGTLKDFMMKEIDVIQSTINRMAANSFVIKGWAITLVVGSLLLSGILHQILIAFVPLVAFWFLDAYFLRQERMYRKLYGWVVTNRLKTDENLFDMNAYRFKDQVESPARTMFSTTLVWFYGMIATLIVIYTVYLLVF